MAKPVPSRSSPQLTEQLEEVDVLDNYVDLTDARVVGDFSSCELEEPQFRGCRIEHSQLTGSTLHHGRLVDCVISDSDLSGAVLQECSLTRVEFRSCRLSGLQAPRDRFVDVGFFSSKMDGANFRMSIWERAELLDCDLADSDFYESTMPASRILRCDLSRVDFSKCNLGDSRLLGSTLDDIRGAGTLRKVTIGSDQIIPAALALFKAFGIIVNDDDL